MTPTPRRFLDLLSAFGWQCVLVSGENGVSKIQLRPPRRPGVSRAERQREEALFLDALGPQLNAIGEAALVAELRRQELASRERLASILPVRRSSSGAADDAD